MVTTNISAPYQMGDSPVPGFVLQQPIAAGSFGSVWRASAPGGTLIAMKVIDLTRPCNLKELRALQLVRNIRHANIVPLIGFWIRCEDGLVADGEAFLIDTERRTARQTLVSPKPAPRAVQLIVGMGLGDMSLHDRLQACQANGRAGLPLDELLHAMEDVARAIDFLNQKRHAVTRSDQPVAIQHCDIKPQNIILVGGSAQLCDLGLARVLDDSRTTRMGFSTAYGAPECLSGSAPSQATDQYSLAISYYELRTGRLPFTSIANPATVIAAHLQGNLDFSGLPSAERAVLQRATALTPSQRYPSTQALVAALRAAATDDAPVVGQPVAGGCRAKPGDTHVTTRQPHWSDVAQPAAGRQLVRWSGGWLLAAVAAAGVALLWQRHGTDRLTRPLNRLVTQVSARLTDPSPTHSDEPQPVPAYLTTSDGESNSSVGDRAMLQASLTTDRPAAWQFCTLSVDPACGTMASGPFPEPSRATLESTSPAIAQPFAFPSGSSHSIAELVPLFSTGSSYSTAAWTVRHTARQLRSAIARIPSLVSNIQQIHRSGEQWLANYAITQAASCLDAKHTDAAAEWLALIGPAQGDSKPKVESMRRVDSIRWYLQQGRVAGQRQTWDVAIQYYTQALAGPLESHPADLALAYRLRGIAYAKQEQEPQALSDLNQALALNPQDKWALRTRALLHLRQGNHALALADQRQLHALATELRVSLPLRPRHDKVVITVSKNSVASSGHRSNQPRHHDPGKSTRTLPLQTPLELLGTEGGALRVALRTAEDTELIYALVAPHDVRSEVKF